MCTVLTTGLSRGTEQEGGRKSADQERRERVRKRVTESACKSGQMGSDKKFYRGLVCRERVLFVPYPMLKIA